MKDRILEFLRIENKSSAQFAEEINVQPSGISHIISGRNNPSLDFVMKMLIKYPSISTDWLLFGKGNMYKDMKIHDLFNASENDTMDLNAESLGKGQKESTFFQNNPRISDNQAVPEPKSGLQPKKIRRIVCFFADDTFREYYEDRE